MMKKKQIKSQILLTIFFLILAIFIVVPFVMLISASFSNETLLSKYGYGILPRGFSVEAYKYVFKNPKSILNAYKITTVFSLSGMVLGTFLMSLIAYPLTKKNLRGRNVLSFYLYFTMLFSGGLIPSYILITQYLHLGDTIWVYILPALISPWQVFMLRTFFQGIPEEIFESAVVDGAGEYRILFEIVVPLSKPALATVALQIFLGKWNDWNTAMLYIDNQNLISLQYLLQRIMENIKVIQENADTAMYMTGEKIPSETVRMAMAMVVAGPILFVFPFFQKYFVRGLTVGSVKG